MCFNIIVSRSMLMSIIFLALNACNDGGGSGNGDPSTQEKNTGEATVLEGSWVHNCYSLDKLGPSWQVFTTLFNEEFYASGEVSYQGNQSDVHIQLFRDAACADKVLDGYTTSSFVIGGNVTTDTGLTATEIDIKVLSSKIDFVDPAMQDTQTGAAANTTYTIFYIDGNVLYHALIDINKVATEGQTLSPDKRPTQLNFELPHTRQ